MFCNFKSHFFVLEWRPSSECSNKSTVIGTRVLNVLEALNAAGNKGHTWNTVTNYIAQNGRPEVHVVERSNFFTRLAL